MPHDTKEVEEIVDKLPYHKENTNGTVSNIRYYERAVVIKALHHQLQKVREELMEKYMALDGTYYEGEVVVRAKDVKKIISELDQDKQ